MQRILATALYKARQSILPVVSVAALGFGWGSIAFADEATTLDTTQAESNQSQSEQPEKAPLDNTVNLSQRYQAADLVAVVRITHVRGVVNRAMSMPGMMAIEAYNYHGAVTHSWKGPGHDVVAFTVSLSDCTQRLQEEEEYIVLSETNKQGTQQSYGCENVVPKAQAQALIAGLDDINSTQIAHQINQ